MSIRTNTFVPNSILTAAQMNDVSNNGVIQVSTAADLADASLASANMAFVVDEMTAYSRIAEGIGEDKWSVFSGGGGHLNAAKVRYGSGAFTGTSFVGDGSNGDAGQHYDVYTWTGTGGFVIPEGDEGLCDILLVGGGGGGAYSDGSSRAGGGGGGVLHVTDVVLGEGSHLITVGAGGAHKANGGHSELSAWEWSKAGGGSKGTSGNSHYAWGISNAGGGSGGAYDRSGGVTDTYNGSGSGGELFNAGTHGNYGDPRGRWVSITGTSVEYARGGPGKGNGQSDPGCAGGGTSGNTGKDGLVVVRVKVKEGSFPSASRATAPSTAHAARIEDGIVREVIVTQDLGADDDGICEYLNDLGVDGRWVYSDPTGETRGKPAGIGDFFIETKAGGEFVTPTVEDPTPPFDSSS